ncbi:MAG: hypothetical protein AB1715_11375 [Acidobacteriota bacterium]
MFGRKLRVAWWGFLLLLASPAQAQPGANGQPLPGRPRVFIDCPGCDLEFLKAQVQFVQQVSRIEEAQVEVVITSVPTPSGEEYTLIFRGLGEFAGDNDVLKCEAARTANPEEIKSGLAQVLKLGLMRYAGKTTVTERLTISFRDQVAPTAVVDKWKFWVFSVSANSFLFGERSFRNAMYYGSFSANRVTPDIKIRLSLSAWHQKDHFEYDDEVFDSSTNSQQVRGLVVWSLGDHWSVGSYFSAFASTYSNIKFSLSAAPAVEYNLFPYSESTRRQLRVLFRLNYIDVSYLEKTIYEKTSERLWQEALSVSLELQQKWGTISTSLEGSNYFHDFSKSRVELWSELSLRLFRGLNFNIRGGYSRIHDQLSLAAGGASLEEILLRRKLLETSYDYHFSVGLSYTFGSTKSTVVNPRFGDGAGGISVSIRM